MIDFHRIPGKSTDWVLGHVRAGQEVVEKEIAWPGSRRSSEVKVLLKENYLVVFRKPAEKKPGKPPTAVSPVVPGYGAVVPLPDAVEQPAKGSKVVFDVTAGKDGQPLPGLLRAATLLNLAGGIRVEGDRPRSGRSPHGDATTSALIDSAYAALGNGPHPAQT